jgi:hypothetical protein
VAILPELRGNIMASPEEMLEEVVESELEGASHEELLKWARQGRSHFYDNRPELLTERYKELNDD